MSYRRAIITHLGADGLYTGQKRVLQTFPETPVKKAAIIETVIDSPRTANILYEKGVCISGERKRKLDLAIDVIEGIKENVNELKPTGTSESKKKAAYDSITM